MITPVSTPIHPECFNSLTKQYIYIFLQLYITFYIDSSFKHATFRLLRHTNFVLQNTTPSWAWPEYCFDQYLCRVALAKVLYIKLLNQLTNKLTNYHRLVLMAMSVKV